MELNSIKPADGAKHAKRRVGRGISSGPGTRLPVAVTRVRSRVRVATTRWASKAVKCLCSVRLPKRGFKSHLLKFNAEVTLSELDKLGLAEVDLAALEPSRSGWLYR